MAPKFFKYHGARMEREKILLSDLKIVSGTGILESEVGSYV
jgi:hypothetical protein